MRRCPGFHGFPQSRPPIDGVDATIVHTQRAQTPKQRVPVLLHALSRHYNTQAWHFKPVPRRRRIYALHVLERSRAKIVDLVSGLGASSGDGAFSAAAPDA